MKSLNQIEPRTIITAVPYVITNRGSYYLTQNLTGVPGSNGITIACSDVDLDLNGFSIIGTTNFGCSGIVLDTASTNLYMNLNVHNGIVSGWSNSGLILSDGVNCRLRGVSAVNSGTGISIGKDWEVDDCLAFRNTGTGIFIGNYSRVRNSRARENGADGFDSGIGSVVDNCLSAGNGGSGFFGQSQSVIRNCVAIGNTNNGIFVGPYSLAINNLCSDNGGDGMIAGVGSTLSGNVCSLNDSDGIDAGSDSLVERNQLNNNGSAGVNGGWGCRVEGNHAVNNGSGFLAATGSKRNLFVRNSAHGNGTNYVTSADANFSRIAHTNNLGPDFLLANPWANFDLQ
jgi:hypothetical protein